MCGIFGYCSSCKSAEAQLDLEHIEREFEKSKHRGPDNSKFVKVTDDDQADILFGFHRLSIIDPTEAGDQPLRHPKYPKIVLICNGEIYNYKKLLSEYQIEETSGGSDCEVILHLYKKFGWFKTIQMLDGVFACTLYDGYTDQFFLARDPFGVRPMYYGFSSTGDLVLSSELKSIDQLCDEERMQFPPGCTAELISGQLSFNRYFDIDKLMYTTSDSLDEDIYCNKIRTALEQAVKKRMMSDRKIGCLLSGGLDSSLIAALVSKYHKEVFPDEKLITFSIGMPGGTDLQYARKVAEHIGSDHHEIIISEEDFCKALEEVIQKIESDDTTTVRASLGNYLISKYISEKTDCIVIFNGDGSDEVCGGYIYLSKAPSLDEFHQECLSLLKEMHLFDVLRSDKSISTNGLEARTPFLDKTFAATYLSVDPRLRVISENRMEKYLLRKAFDGTGLLPDEVLWRRKEAFSDGVSSVKKNTQTILQQYIESEWNKVDDSNKTLIENLPIRTPHLLESKYFTYLYLKHYTLLSRNIIPHYWLPKWSGDVKDPSARELHHYHSKPNLLENSSENEKRERLAKALQIFFVICTGNTVKGYTEDEALELFNQVKAEHEETLSKKLFGEVYFVASDPLQAAAQCLYPPGFNSPVDLDERDALKKNIENLLRMYYDKK